MTFLDLLKKIQSDGPIKILEYETIVIEPDVFDEIVKEFEGMSHFRDFFVAEKKTGDRLYDTIRRIAETLKIEDWTTDNIVEKITTT